jgi:hypothetical protein
VAAGEDQAQPIVLDAVVNCLLVRPRIESLGKHAHRLVEPRSAPDDVNSLESPRRDQPRAG